MSSTLIAGSGTAFKELRPGQFLRTADIPGNRDVSHSLDFADVADNGNQDRFGELLRMSGIDLSPDESRELKIFDEFLLRHVQPNGNCDVQCMLLWNEWVRVFRRRASGFPNMIREKEFRSIITGTFGAGIATDGWRGAVYSGVRFVP